MKPNFARKNKPARVSPSTRKLERGRCQFPFSDGRHCRMPRWKKHRYLCVYHAHREALLVTGVRPHGAKKDRVARELISVSGGFNTATDVNHVLGKVFSLLAQNRIPRRDAVALAYIGQLLLQSLSSTKSEFNDALGYRAWYAKVKEMYGVPSTAPGKAADQIPARAPDNGRPVQNLKQPIVRDLGGEYGATRDGRAARQVPWRELPVKGSESHPAEASGPRCGTGTQESPDSRNQSSPGEGGQKLGRPAGPAFVRGLYSKDFQSGLSSGSNYGSGNPADSTGIRRMDRKDLNPAETPGAPGQGSPAPEPRPEWQHFSGTFRQG
jgi:hypothetical protein